MRIRRISKIVSILSINYSIFDKCKLLLDDYHLLRGVALANLELEINSTGIITYLHILLNILVQEVIFLIILCGTNLL